MRRRFLLLFAFTCLLSLSNSNARQYQLASPDQKIKVQLFVSDQVSFSVWFKNQQIIKPSAIGMRLDEGRWLGKDISIHGVQRTTIRETLQPVIKVKNANIENHCNQLMIQIKGDYGLILRAYNDGFAYRWFTNFKKDIEVFEELATFEFGSDHPLYFAQEESFYTHSERLYQRMLLSEVTADRMGYLPAVIDIPSGPKVAILEADLEDYPGMYLTGSLHSPTALLAKFPYFPLEFEQRSDRDVLVTRRADFLVKTRGQRVFPWRVLIIAERDAELVESQMVYKLAKDCQIANPSWIRPGKVAWDWWNWNNIYGVDFRAGINTKTYQYYIDFASRFGIEYVILDEGWYRLGNLLEVVPEIDIPQLVAYGREKNVGIILWMSWKTLDDQLEPALEQFVRWGIKGIKVDFMQRDDQPMVNYYYKVAQEAAKRQLLVDFHGAYKPTGLIRTYPNVLTSEGVRGLEWSKWSTEDPNPEHNVTLPFTRMLAGPMDYTPGAMINATKEQFRPVFQRPMSQGTRCHQLAMYVVFESPLQMLCDSPSNYLREAECMEFLARVPTTWDETRVLAAQMADFIVIARRHGNDWFIGAMTDWTARDLMIDFSFLGDKKYTIELFQDGINADRNAMDFKKQVMTVHKGEQLKVHLAPGGGWVAWLHL
ncbi:MAG: glycoside hydrolase family 97 protein [candidate division KSB1 bacterium]|nr:glycoside hydrolase family 97 protein [candidate division KSB1 bacterium]